MEAKFEVPSELAREWARKRWAKPNARQREAQQRVRRRLAAARDQGDLALAVFMMREVLEAATLMLGRHRLLDERTSRVLALAQAAALGGVPVNSGAAKEAGSKTKEADPVTACQLARARTGPPFGGG